MVKESLEDAVIAKESSQPQSSYEVGATLIELELKKILIDKMDKSESYLEAPQHRECYEGLKKSYDLDKTIFSTYGKVYSVKRSQKDKDEDPSAGSDRGLKKRKTGKDATPKTGPKAKESQFGSSKVDKSQLKTSRKFVQSEEPEFEVADSYMPLDQEKNLGNDDEEAKEKNVDNTPQQGQNQSWLMTLASSAKKPSKAFDELMSTLIDFSSFIMNSLKINNLTQETLLGPAFRLLKGTHSNYAELEYDFEECYKSLSEKLDLENLEGDDYPYDLTKPLPFVMSRNRKKYLLITSSTTISSICKEALKTWFQIYGFLLKLPMINMHYEESHIGENNVEVMRKHGYGYLKEIVVRRADNVLYRFKEGNFLRLRINDIKDMLLLVV
ncbi:hypothetical protein Tco_1438967 [Tanacetum coccineum]